MAMKSTVKMPCGNGYSLARLWAKNCGAESDDFGRGSKICDYRIGMAGEVLAAAYLQARGYQLLTSNYRFAHREIDLILRKDGFLVFVEVKTRAPGSLIVAPLTVDTRKQMFLYSVASKYIRENHLTEEVRFDIVWIERKGSACRVVEHIRNAFSPYAG